jgi:replicative DNA helicase
VNRLTEGYKPGELWIVCGRPGMSKSAFVFETARRVAEGGGRVLIFSLEMTKEAVVERWIAALSGVEARVFRRGVGNIPACLTAISKLDAIKTLWIDDQPALSPSQVRSRAIHKARQEGGLDLIVLDHGRKMNLDGRGENTAKTEGRKTAMMKDLSKELRCPFLLALQLNRGVEGRTDKRPSLADLRDSGEHEEEADGVLGLYRDEYYNENTTTRHVMELLALKQREGPSGASRATLYYDATIQKFGDLTTRRVEA